MTTGARPDVTIIIPAKDEAENLPPLLNEIVAALASAGPYEVIVVDDGSSDGTDTVIRDLMRTRDWLRLVCHDRAAGKSAAIRSGALAASGDLIVTLDGDGQNNPADIPAMLALLRAQDTLCALVAAERTGRTDTGVKRLASRFANGLRSRLLRDGTRDTANGLKAMRRDVYLALPFFDTMHRFFPALVVREGFSVDHVSVVDRARQHGTSKYGILDRALLGVTDLFGMLWLRRRRKVVPVSTEIKPADNRDG